MTTTARKTVCNQPVEALAEGDVIKLVEGRSVQYRRVYAVTTTDSIVSVRLFNRTLHLNRDASIPVRHEVAW